jgi:hypothetical protein
VSKPTVEQKSYHILHDETFQVIKVLQDSSQARVYACEYKNVGLENQDKNLVILKQFKLSKESNGFKKELKILKKIRSLDLEDNGGLPIIISAKLSPTLGEIVMSYVGNDIFNVFNISHSLDDASNHIKLSHSQISDLGMQIVS